jgi:hypothetical protein
MASDSSWVSVDVKSSMKEMNELKENQGSCLAYILTIWTQNLPVATSASSIQPGYTETLVSEPREEEMDGADEEKVDEGVN